MFFHFFLNLLYLLCQENAGFCTKDQLVLVLLLISLKILPEVFNPVRQRNTNAYWGPNIIGQFVFFNKVRILYCSPPAAPGAVALGLGKTRYDKPFISNSRLPPQNDQGRRVFWFTPAVLTTGGGNSHPGLT